MMLLLFLCIKRTIGMTADAIANESCAQLQNDYADDKSTIRKFLT